MATIQNALLQAQVYTESAWGTSGAATAKLADITDFSIDPDITAEVPENKWGSLSPSEEGVLLAHAGGGKFTQRGLYEDVCYWLDNVFGQATPGGSYTRAWTGPGTSVPTPRVLSFYWGKPTTAADGYRCTGGLLQNLTIKSQSKGYTEVSGAFTGKVSEQAALASLADRTVNKILGRHWTIYVDAWGGTIGTTAVSSSLYSFELSINCPRSLLTYMGSSVATDYSFEPYSYALKLRLEYNTTTDDFITETLSQSAVFERQIRLQADDTASRQLRLDFAGIATKAPSMWQSESGRVVYELEMTGRYNSTLGAAFKASSLNGVSALA